GPRGDLPGGGRRGLRLRLAARGPRHDGEDAGGFPPAHRRHDLRRRGSGGLRPEVLRSVPEPPPPRRVLALPRQPRLSDRQRRSLAGRLLHPPPQPRPERELLLVRLPPPPPGNAHVAVIDSDESTSPGSPQYLFLDQDLGTSTAQWKFVAFHHTIYSTGAHGSNLPIQANLAPLFDAHGVDIVFMGHDHDYERTSPLRANQIVP